MGKHVEIPIIFVSVLNVQTWVYKHSRWVCTCNWVTHCVCQSISIDVHVCVSPCECVFSAHRGLVFMEHLVVSTQSHTEDNSGHVLKAVDPFLPLRPLTSHIKQPEWTQLIMSSPHNNALHHTSKIQQLSKVWGQYNLNTSIQQGHIKSIKCESKDTYNIKKGFQKYFYFI